MKVIPSRPAIRIANDTLAVATPATYRWHTARRKKTTCVTTPPHLRLLGLDDADNESPSDQEQPNREQAATDSATEVQNVPQSLMASIRSTPERTSGSLHFDATSVANDAVGRNKPCDVETASLPIRPSQFDLKNYTWFGLFIFIVLVFSSIASAQSIADDCMTVYSGEPRFNTNWLGTLQHDATTFFSEVEFPSSHPLRSDVLHSGSVHREMHSYSKPHSVQFSAVLANFDSDVAVDGWAIQLAVLDRFDHALVMPAFARFELRPDDFPIHPSIRRRRPSTVLAAPIRWSMKVAFDEDGIARIKLPVRASQRTALGWTSGSEAGLGMANLSTSVLHARAIRPVLGLGSNDPRWLATGKPYDWRESFVYPVSGTLNVRLSIASQGTFESTIPVNLR
ncbi:hypothetical protein SH528x_004794 [Novipirellula sp. SH528]|uniref:hypothetical protein n=1 Tax=Novipirellula sp. SH528 TaxID=3454466 RepID=UPI003FA14BB0